MTRVIYIYIYIYICVCICEYVCVYVCTFVFYMYICINFYYCYFSRSPTSFQECGRYSYQFNLQWWKQSGFFLWCCASSNLPVIPLVLVIFVKSYSYYRVTYFYMIKWWNYCISRAFCLVYFLSTKSYSAPETPCSLL